MPISWSHEANAKLLRCILDVHNIKVDNKAVAARMTEMTGEVVTENAVCLHVGRMKSKFKNGQNATDPGKGKDNAGATEGSSAPTKKRKNRDDDTGSSQAKPEKKKLKSKVKVEEPQTQTEVDLNWATLTSGEDGAALAEQIRAFMHDRFQQVALPKFVRSVQVHTFDFGTVAPDLEVKDVCDPLPDFYEEDEEDEDMDHQAEGNGEHVSTRAMNETSARDAASFNEGLRSRQGGSNHDDLPAHHSAATGGASRPKVLSGLSLQPNANKIHNSSVPPAPYSPAMDSANPLYAFRSQTPGIPGGTSNLSYFHLPLSGGLSGTATPLAAVAGSHRPANQQYPQSRSAFASPAPPPFPKSPLPPPPEQIMPPSPSENSKDTENDLQTILHLRYSGDIRLTLTADILLDYPMPSFVGIPLQLTVTGLSFDGVAILAYIRQSAAGDGRSETQGDDETRQKLCFCFLNKDDASAVVGEDAASVDIGGNETTTDTFSATSASPRSSTEKSSEATGDAGVGALFTNIKVESEIGRRTDSASISPTSATAANATGTATPSSIDTSSSGSRLGDLSDIHSKLLAQQQLGVHPQAQAQPAQTSQQPVLKNVGKVEKFVLEQVRRIFEDELVYPSFWSFLV
ncbi:MAG: Mitochondrial distribution and morphology protein 12 [Alyxoria varia]|nr:MAG: Mitochondrial distribution and morphology protein 12 [Alyxoria varia]